MQVKKDKDCDVTTRMAGLRFLAAHLCMIFELYFDLFTVTKRKKAVATHHFGSSNFICSQYHAPL